MRWEGGDPCAHAGIGISLAILRRFWALAAHRTTASLVILPRSDRHHPGKLAGSKPVVCRWQGLGIRAVSGRPESTGIPTGAIF